MTEPDQEEESPEQAIERVTNDLLDMDEVLQNTIAKLGPFSEQHVRLARAALETALAHLNLADYWRMRNE